MKDLNKKIDILVYNAKMWSDNGHNDYNYGKKDHEIKTIITLIHILGSHSKWHYYVGLDDKGRKVIYFWTNLNGKRFQISFHSYCSKDIAAVGDGLQTTWFGKRKSNMSMNVRLGKFYDNLKKVRDR